MQLKCDFPETISEFRVCYLSLILIFSLGGEGVEEFWDFQVNFHNRAQLINDNLDPQDTLRVLTCLHLPNTDTLMAEMRDINFEILGYKWYKLITVISIY